MGQPFQPGPPPYNPSPTPGWAAPTGPRTWQPAPGYPSGSGRGAADAIAAAALALAAILFLMRRIWLYVQLDKFFWSDVIVIISILFALVATILLLTTRKPATARVAGGIGVGLILAPNISYIFSAFDRVRGVHSAWADGGWLSIPATLIALIAIGTLFAAASSGRPQHASGAGPQPLNSWPQPSNSWPQPPMGQPPVGYPGQPQPLPPQ